MRNYRLISSILSRPWMIDPSWVKANLGLVESLLTGGDANMGSIAKGSFAMDQGDEEAAHERNLHRPRILSVKGSTVSASFYRSFNDAPEGSLAVIPVIGPIAKYYDCGVAGSSDMARWVKEANASSKISGIILQLDTPGGMVDGTQSLADAILACTKPVTAYVDDGMAASAGMWIASACDEIVLSQKTDAVGSIGVLTTFLDYSGFFEQKGIKYRDIYAPQSTDKSADYRAAMEGNDTLIEADLKFLAAEFIKSIKSNRSGKLNLEAGDPFTGKLYYAKDAIEIGLADRIGTIENAVESTYSRVGSTKATTKNSNYMFGAKYPKLTALKDKKAEEITAADCEAASAELQAVGISVHVTTQSLIDAHVAAEKKPLEDSLTEQKEKVTTLTSERDEFKSKAEKLPLNAGSETNGEKPEEGGNPAEESANEFETQADRDLAKLKGLTQPKN